MLNTARTLEELFVCGYLEAVKFTDGGPDQPDIEDAEFSAETYREAEAQCMAFVRVAGADLNRAVQQVGYDWVRAGHDLWFTRNGHGVGFWDRKSLEAGDLGQKLSAFAHDMGPSESYLDEEGKIRLTLSMATVRGEA